MFDRRQFLVNATLAAATIRAMSSTPTACEPAVLRFTGTTLGKLPPLGLGFSVEKDVVGRDDFFSVANKDLIGCCNRLGPNVMRVGGNHVDMGRGWVLNGPGGDKDQTSPRDIQRFAGFLKTVGWKAVYGVAIQNNTPEKAAEEAAVAAKLLGPDLLALEIGNEPNLFVFHKYRNSSYGYPQFLKEWRSFADAIRKTVPGIPLSGPGAARAGVEDFALPFAVDEGRNIVLLTQHYYRSDGREPGATVEALFGGLPALYDELALLVSAARKGGVADGFRMIETNSFVGGGSPGVSDAMATALWVIDYVLTAAELGVNGLNFQIGRDRSFNTPIVMGENRIDEIRPEFYALAMLADLGVGTMERINMENPTPGLSAFALRGAGGLVVVLNNKHPENAAQVRIIIGGNQTRVDVVRLTAPGLLAKKGIKLGGATIETDGAGKASATSVAVKEPGIFTVELPAASAATLRMGSA